MITLVSRISENKKQRDEAISVAQNAIEQHGPDSSEALAARASFNVIAEEGRRLVNELSAKTPNEGYNGHSIASLGPLSK